MNSPSRFTGFIKMHIRLLLGILALCVVLGTTTDIFFLQQRTDTHAAASSCQTAVSNMQAFDANLKSNLATAQVNAANIADTLASASVVQLIINLSNQFGTHTIQNTATQNTTAIRVNCPPNSNDTLITAAATDLNTLQTLVQTERNEITAGQAETDICALGDTLFGLNGAPTFTPALASYTQGSSTQTQDRYRFLPAIITLSRTQYPESVQHIEQAVTAGYPNVLTLDAQIGVPPAGPGRSQAQVDAEKAAAEQRCKQRRSQFRAGNRPARAGFDRDEYPFAMTLEGGNGSGRQSSLMYISPSDNRGAGTTMKNQIEALGLRNGDKFTVHIVP